MGSSVLRKRSFTLYASQRLQIPIIGNKKMEKRIIVGGSLNPEKECQDRVRVLVKEGICQGLRATDYKDPPKVIRRWTRKQGT